MKIALVSYSDIRGGAAVVTNRLAEALRAEGHDARMIVFSKESPSENVEVISSRPRRMGAKIAERLEIFVQNGFSKAELFKVSTGSTGSGILDNSFVREADAIILAWVNQGAVSLEDIKALGQMGKPILYVMHDMWCFTGICHHSIGCTNYKKECGNCRFLGMFKGKNDLSHRVWKKKKNVYSATGIKFIAVSSWLKEKADESSLLKGEHTYYIPNPFPVDEFHCTPNNRSALTDLGINPGKRLLLMGAARLDDTIKDLPTAIAALNITAERDPMFKDSFEVVFFGNLRNTEILSTISFPYVYTGMIKEKDSLRNLYASADIVLSSSLFETLPGTLIEGQASGALPVTFGNGGQKDIITHLKDGYIASEHSPEALATGIEWAMSQKQDREVLKESVRLRFDSKIIARKILELI